MSLDETRAELARRVDAIEGGYEMMLAYAAQGLPSDHGAASGAQLREHLKRFDEALSGLADLFRGLAHDTGAGPLGAIDAFLDVLARDAAAAQAALRVVVGQPAISSQLVDNLNASIHVRALLTDLFLVDELLKQSG
jgi:hypothetical protein